VSISYRCAKITSQLLISDVMKKILFMMGMVICLHASAKCQHVEFAELKEMSTSSLALEYCGNNFSMTNLNIQMDSTKKHISLEAGYRGDSSPTVLMLQNKLNALGEEYDSCNTESGRIKPILDKRKLDASTKQLIKSCKAENSPQ